MTDTVQEKNHVYYDDIYRKTYPLEHMWPIYLTILDLLKGYRAITPRVLEIGCGIGKFGQMVHDAGIKYRGFDFSAVAIRMCPNDIRAFVARRNAYHRVSYRVDHNVIVAIEVMEHLRDLEVIELFAKGTHCIFTLPNFTDEAHLRTYDSKAAIKKYYKGKIKWSKIIPVEMAEDEGIACGKKVIYICKGFKL